MSQSAPFEGRKTQSFLKNILNEESAVSIRQDISNREDIQLEGVDVSIGYKDGHPCVLIIPAAGNSILLKPLAFRSEKC
jgi:hypothetical protein